MIRHGRLGTITSMMLKHSCHLISFVCVEAVESLVHHSACVASFENSHIFTHVSASFR